MKINLVKDKSGKVLASYEHAGKGGATLKPLLADGERVEEVEVAENYRDNLAAIYVDKQHQAPSPEQT